jgi:dihydroneopterin aldolase
MKDIITIEDIQVCCRIGVPDDERANPQQLLISLALETATAKAGQTDDIGQTIDYHSVYIRTRELAEARERKLIETLAEELAGMILGEFRTDAVTVIIKKFILPETRHVELRIRRSRA